MSEKVSQTLKTSHPVVRDTDGTGNTNYGNMSLYEIDGVQFVSCTGEVEYFPGAVVVPCEEIPLFVAHITLRLVINVHYKEVWIYPLKKEDIRALGEKLSIKQRVVATAACRNYATWESGRLTKGPVPLSDFYSNITAEEEESFRF